MKSRKRIRFRQNTYLSLEIRKKGKGFDVSSSQYGLTEKDVIVIFEKMYRKRKQLSEFIFGGKL